MSLATEINALATRIAQEIKAVRIEASNSLRVVRYSGEAYPARPNVPAGLVRYVGPTQPTTWLADDEWINNS